MAKHRKFLKRTVCKDGKNERVYYCCEKCMEDGYIQKARLCKTPEEKEAYRRAKKHEYYLQHREERQAYYKKYWQDHTDELREKHRGYSRKYYWARKKREAESK